MPRPEMGTDMINMCAIISSGRILLIRRSEHNKRGVGKWELPGGKIENQMEMQEEILREVREETGYEVRLCKQLGWRFSKDVTGSKFRETPFVTLYWLARRQRGRLKLSPEHDSSGWYTYKEALELPSISDRTRDFMRKYKTSLKDFGLAMN